MRILAIDSSGLVASVCIITEETLIAEYSINFKKTHSQTLLPMIDEILRMTDIGPDSLDAIAIANGPGSFTGLRIGASTVKGLAMIWDKPIVAVPTVDALAYNLQGTNRLVVPLMDARREQVYTGIYEFCEGKLKPHMEQSCKAITEVLDAVNTLGREVVFLGDGVEAYKEMLATKLLVPYSFAPAHLSKQRAGAVGGLALEYLKEGKTTTAMELVPEYLRPVHITPPKNP